MAERDKPAAFTPVVGFDGPPPPPQHYGPPAERIVAGNPRQTVWNYFSSPDGRFHSGIWESQVGTWRVVFSENEFCHLLAGAITVTGDDGSVHTYRAGDAFVTPAGFTGCWEVIEPARKYYAIYE
jgi:uncharacterized cupin superfamily protein